jgi:hypothetical protein
MAFAPVRRVLPMLLAMLLASPALAAKLVVATQTTLNAALAQLLPGDTLRLEGVFTNRITIRNRDFGGVLVDGSQATLREGMVLNNVHNISFHDLTIGSLDAGTTTLMAVTMDRSTHVSFNRARVLGNGDDRGTGMRITNSQFVTVRDSLFDSNVDGLTLNNTPDSLLTGNSFVNGGSDGIKIADSQRVIVSHNSCTNFQTIAGVHPDCIQFWSKPGNPLQSDIYVLNNLVIGDQQGFTSFDPAALSGTRFTFAGNYAAITRVHALACFGCTESRFENNVISSLPQSTWAANIHVPGGSNNVFSNNLIFDLRGVNGALADILPARVFSAIVPSIAGVVGSQQDNRSWDVDEVVVAQQPVNPVPEPGTWLMMGAGFVMIGRAMRRRPPHRVVMA